MELNKIYCQDNLEFLKSLPDNSIDMIFGSPPYDCYSEDTEVLTYNGWKLIKDTKIGERALTVDPNTKIISWQNIIKTYSYPYSGKLVNFKNNSIDLLVTPNHRMYVENRDGSAIRKREGRKNKEKLISSFYKEAKEIKSSHLLRLSDFKFNGNNQEYFILPGVEKTILGTNQNIKKTELVQSLQIDMLLWCKFLGIYLSEGSSRGTKGGAIRSEVNIAQKSGPSSDYIENILKKLPFKYTKTIEINKYESTMHRYNIWSQQLHHYLFQFGNSYEKFVSKEILELSPRYLQAFMEGYLLGDGTHCKHNTIFGKYENVKTYSKKLQDNLLEIIIKVGSCAKILKNNLVSFPNREYSKISQFKKEVQYSGTVHCIEVEQNNIIFVRRKGKCIFSGNSIRDYKNKNRQFNTRQHLCTLGLDIYRVLKDGGVCALVIQDATIKGHKTLSTFGTIMDWCQDYNIRFNLFETLIYYRSGTPGCFWNKRFRVEHEYVPIFLKGKRPAYFNKEHMLIPSKSAGKHMGASRRKTDGTMDPYNTNYAVKPTRCCGTVLKYANSSQESTLIYGLGTDIGRQLKKTKLIHPASFPYKICSDLIKCFCPKGGVVIDLWLGGGETAIAAQLSGRNWVGVDIEQSYVDLARKRLSLLPTNVY